jgi:hypothetical protein
MDLKNLDAELNVKIIESFKEILKKKNVIIIFDIPNEELLEGSTIIQDDNNFRLIKRLIINEIDDLNLKYVKFISKKIMNENKELNQPQALSNIIKKTKHLFFLRPFLGKKIIKTKIRSIIFRINYNNVVIDLPKAEYDKMNYYTKYVYKLQQLQKLNIILNINQTYNVVFDDDIIAKNLYKSMYDNLGDIIKPPSKNI